MSHSSDVLHAALNTSVTDSATANGWSTHRNIKIPANSVHIERKKNPEEMTTARPPLMIAVIVPTNGDICATASNASCIVRSPPCVETICPMVNPKAVTPEQTTEIQRRL